MALVRHLLSLTVVALGTLGAASCGGGGDPGPYPYYCRTAYDCAPGTSCVEREGGSCWSLCRGDADCGPGYRCSGVSRHGSGGKDDVCVPR